MLERGRERVGSEIARLTAFGVQTFQACTVRSAGASNEYEYERGSSAGPWERVQRRTIDDGIESLNSRNSLLVLERFRGYRFDLVSGHAREFRWRQKLKREREVIGREQEARREKDQRATRGRVGSEFSPRGQSQALISIFSFEVARLRSTKLRKRLDDPPHVQS